MPRFEFSWTEAIIEHLAEHDVSPEDFEHVGAIPTAREPAVPRICRVVGVRPRMAVSLCVSTMKSTS